MKNKNIWSKQDVSDIKKRFQYYVEKMYLGEWFFDIRFENWYCVENWEIDKNVAANTDVMSEYKKARITFFITARNEYRHGWEWIDSVIKHELAHSATDKLTKLAEERFLSQREIDKECESLTQYISNCVNSDYKDVQWHTTKRVNKVNKVLAKPKN